MYIEKYISLRSARGQLFVSFIVEVTQVIYMYLFPVLLQTYQIITASIIDDNAPPKICFPIANLLLTRWN